MKKCNLLFLLVIVLASCSAPKYTYHFDHHDYNSGRKNKTSSELTASVEQPAQAVLAIDETITSNVKKDEVYVSTSEARAKINSMSKEERKELKKKIRKFVKENRNEIRDGNVSPMRRLENDQKLAAIFGLVGIVFMIIGGNLLYVLGAIALLIGVYFFVRWLTYH